MESKFKMPWYPWFPGDYMNDGDVMDMTIAEDLLYRRLLDLAWVGGGIPTDPNKIQLLSRFGSDDFKAAWPSIQKRFVLSGDRLVNEKMEEIRKEQQVKHERRVSAGSKGGSNAARNASSVGGSMLFGSGSGSVSSSEGVKEGSGKPLGGFDQALFDSVRVHHPHGEEDIELSKIQWGMVHPKPDQIMAERMIAVLKHYFPRGSRSWLDQRQYVKLFGKWLAGKNWTDAIPADRPKPQKREPIMAPRPTSEAVAAELAQKAKGSRLLTDLLTRKEATR